LMQPLVHVRERASEGPTQACHADCITTSDVQSIARRSFHSEFLFHLTLPFHLQDVSVPFILLVGIDTLHPLQYSFYFYHMNWKRNGSCGWFATRILWSFAYCSVVISTNIL
jgi:hypothetical protein